MRWAGVGQRLLATSFLAFPLVPSDVIPRLQRVNFYTRLCWAPTPRSLPNSAPLSTCLETEVQLQSLLQQEVTSSWCFPERHLARSAAHTSTSARQTHQKSSACWSRLLPSRVSSGKKITTFLREVAVIANSCQCLYYLVGISSPNSCLCRRNSLGMTNTSLSISMFMIDNGREMPNT